MLNKVCYWILLFSMTCLAQVPLKITGIVNSADLRPGFSQRGSLTTLLLTGLDIPEGASINRKFTLGGTLSNYLLDVETWVNFAPAPIISMASQNSVQQIVIQIPWEGVRDPLYVEVFQGSRRAAFEGQYTNYGLRSIEYGPWSVWFVDSAGRALVQHASNYSPVTPQNPAHGGEQLIAYGINLAPVSNTPATGQQSPVSPLAKFNPAAMNPGICTASESVLLGSKAADVSYDGLTPLSIGVYQINFQLPSDLGTGDVQIAMQRKFSVFPFGVCHIPELQTVDTTLKSVPAVVAVAP